MPRELLTVDADGHVLEPADTWQRYIDPKFKDRALRVAIDADGFENLFIDNRPTIPKSKNASLRASATRTGARAARVSLLCSPSARNTTSKSCASSRTSTKSA